jgi:ATP-dependent Clp protease ATP-binding subunit ClpX
MDATVGDHVDAGIFQGHSFDDVIPQDLVEYGMIPEFLGRFPIITATHEIDVCTLVDILTKPKNSVLKQCREVFSKNGVEFHVTDDALTEIAQKAILRRTGARGLRSILDSLSMEAQFIIPSVPCVHTVYCNAAVVRGESKPFLLTDPYLSVKKFESLMKQGIDDIEGAVPVNISAFVSSFSSDGQE